MLQGADDTMSIDWNLAVAVGMPILTLFLGALLNHLLISRPRLISYLGFVSSHRMEPDADGKPGPIVNTHSLVLRNSGKKSAQNVRLGHHFLPNVNIYPDITYHVEPLPGGGKEIVIPTLVPKKEITINYLYFAPATWDQINTHIESDSGPAKRVNVLLQPQVKPWLRNTIWTFLISGVVAVVYLLFEVIRWFAT